ncbi:tetratricopeptide repeat protein [Granulicella arctica]|uniref:Tetratricopeptide (TPR) repeat protein n=1 Tax=Granulicella arctica TaxID=940613 RepID=A0A7Y9PGZ5_9BACT|nr:tetratricopeptide repeat protein [Granulicella arctica]NYF79545.1 tetratricopeptide (TPR) repeat protein [Granulicella arctica]
MGESTDHWVEVHSTHFIVLTDSNEKQARRITLQFEQMRSVFHTLLPTATADAGSPIIVLAFKDRKGFQSIEPEAYLAKNQLDLAGLFLRAPDKHYILLRLDAQGEHPFSTVYHEYTHLMMGKATWVPLWLNEGLAEFYQNTDIHEKEVLLGEPSSDDILYLRQNRLLPLTTLFSVDYTSPYYHDEQKGSVFYAESWALTHYIMVTDREKNADRIGDYAKLLVQHEDPVTAAQHAFGDLKQLQKSLDNYVEQGSFKMFRMNTAITADQSSFQVRFVPKPEVDAIRADVLVDNGRTKDAQALLDNTLRDDPKNALAHEVMGSLKFREGDIASARKWYGEAIQLDSQSYLAHYYYATMSMQGSNSEQDAAIESSLRASIRLNPAFAPAYDALAMFYAFHQQKFREAHILNVQAVELEPENLDYRINTATVLSMEQQYPGALGVLKAAKRVAKTPDEIAQLQTRIEQLQKFQAAADHAHTVNAENAAQVTIKQTTSLQPQTGDTSVTGTGKTVVFKKVDGKMIGTTEAAPKYPAEDSTGPRHTITGVIRGVQCSYPAVIALSIEQAGKAISLYNNNFYKIDFTLGNYTSNDEIKPCTDIEGMKASVKYAEISAPNVAGQILAIELNK